MTTDPVLEITDRQARAVIEAAEIRGFEREPYLLWWRYDDALLRDAESALQFLREQHAEDVEGALSGDDPLPVWVAVERIMDERGGVNGEQVRQLIAAAVDARLIEASPLEPSWPPRDWEVARDAVEQLWQSDFDRLKDILGRHATLAMIPDTAVQPCPSVCEGGWVPYKFAGELPAEPPKPRHAPF